MTTPQHGWAAAALPADEIPDALVGTTLDGRYLIARVLGRGGGGTVYEGTHQDLGRAVAIKVLAAMYASDVDAGARFLREARTASRIGHPNIVQVYDLGRVPDGRPYLAMERLDGHDLADVLSRGRRFTPKEVARIIAEAASALDAVHAHGIVHRDIKPENFMMTRYADDSLHVKLVDFGLAAYTQPSKRGPRLTQENIVVGTPAYVAPEACDGALPDHRADIYALGIVAFELIADAAPFDAPTHLRILTMKMTMDPPTMEQLAGRSFPPGLEAVVAKAIARKPGDRYASAGAFAKELTRELEALAGPSGGVPAVVARARVATTEPSDERPALPTTRGPRIFAAAIIALLVVGGSVAAYTAVGSHAAPTRPSSPRPAVHASQPGIVTEPAVPPSASLDPGHDSTATPVVPTSPPTREGHASHARVHETRAAEPPPAPAPVPAPTPAVAAPPPPRATEDDQGPDTQPADVDRSRAEEDTREGTNAMIGGLLPQAIDHFRAATNAWPRCAPAWRGLGIANERLGRAPEAVHAYRRYVQLAPAAADASSVQQRIAALGGG